ncbi:class I SAM-dependent RNA methyltransferase [Anaerotruncus rubiinfantis]|uniref:class I SAM-dependent RNA methyltransferase n=1 Tax=Anaerotruncus rubiinfantis TaxID=1720200 RepID=UPI0034A310A9
MDQIYRICCPCLFGLESVLSFEVKKIGGENVEVTDGRVFFDGDLQMVAKANLWLRTAERVGIVMGRFKAETFTELFDRTADLPWEHFIGEDDQFPVKGSSLNSKLHSVPDCQRIIKRAVVRRFESVYKRAVFAETGTVYQVQFTIHKDMVTLLLDTSGAGLHKRGYRANANEAPIKETLAAGIVDFARVRGDSTVYDPMCGSGTLVIEAALKALNIAPGIRRRFAAQNWACFANGIFSDLRKAAAAEVRRDAQFLAFASDNDSQSVKLTQENAVKAGVASRIKVYEGDVADFQTRRPGHGGIVLTNPPYGERLLDASEAQEICRMLGTAFPPEEGMSYYIISPDEDFEAQFGRPAVRRRKLYNGMIKCQLFMYFEKPSKPQERDIPKN